MRLLKPFGADGNTRRRGYDLPLLVGHLEGLASDEGDNIVTAKGPRAMRLEKVEAAIGLLNEAIGMGSEEL